jgi:hypothetical protein
MEIISESRKANLEKLKQSMIKLKDKKNATCWYGVKCFRKFCKFDHGNIFRKDNRIVIQIKPDVEDISDFLCEQCGFVCRSKEMFYTHVKSIHEKMLGNETQMHCKECTFSSKSRSDLNHHVSQNHNDFEIECEICGRFFVSRNELNKHRKSHAQNHTDIDLISERLEGLLEEKNLNQQDKEMQERKGAISGFICDECDESFRTKGILNNHILTFHTSKNMNYKDEDLPEQIGKFSSNRKLECGLCDVDFHSVEEMNQHMDEEHEGRWKFDDPDVVMLGDDYEESEYSETDEEVTETENSESQSGEE